MLLSFQKAVMAGAVLRCRAFIRGGLAGVKKSGAHRPMRKKAAPAGKAKAALKRAHIKRGADSQRHA
ncbi:hypothetical protein AD949_04665 [Acetobacter orleanensis]|nr:hypothetical protein AD949_04665 [Acetobacter orleanensis]PCD80125.1 hypothetical protein CO710_04600 [Acetobacter orleanensis]